MCWGWCVDGRGWRAVVTYAVGGRCGGRGCVASDERVDCRGGVVKWYRRGSRKSQQAAKFLQDPAFNPETSKKVCSCPKKMPTSVLSLTQDLLPPPRSQQRPQGEQMKVIERTCQTYRQTLPAQPAEARHCTGLRSSPRSKLRTSASLLGSGHRLISQVGVCGSCREHSYGRLL